MVFNYEKKIYSNKQSTTIPFLNGGVVGLTPDEFKSLSKKAKVLDVGCGAGYYTNQILQKKFPKFNITGVDISQKAIEKANINYPGICFKTASVYKLPFPKASFDLVILNCILEHLSDPQKALQEVKRVLKPKGLFFSITPIEAQRGVYFQDVNLSKKYHGHLQRFDTKSLKSKIQNAKFKINRIYYTGFWFCQAISGAYMRLYRDLNKKPDYQIPGRFNLIKYLVNFFINLESLIFTRFKIPGLYMHIISTHYKW